MRKTLVDTASSFSAMSSLASENPSNRRLKSGSSTCFLSQEFNYKRKNQHSIKCKVQLSCIYNLLNDATCSFKIRIFLR